MLLSSEEPRGPSCSCAGGLGGESSWQGAYRYSQGLCSHHRSPF